MPESLTYSGGILKLFFYFLFAFLLFAPFLINYKLIKSRSREKEKLLWFCLTVLFSWVTTLILAIMKPKEAVNYHIQKH